MSNVENVMHDMQLENRTHIDTDFLFDYITGIDEDIPHQVRAELEIPPGKRYCVMLSAPMEQFGIYGAAKIYKGFKTTDTDVPLVLCRNMGYCVLTVMKDCSEHQTRSIIERAQEIAGIKFFTVYADGLCGCRMYAIYEKLEKQLERVFYSENGELSVKADFEKGDEVAQFEMVAGTVLDGGVKNTEMYFRSLFKLIECSEPPVCMIKSYLVKLYSDMLIQNIGHNDAEMIKAVADIMKAQYLSQIKCIVINTAKKLANKNIPENGDVYSPLVRETVHIINDNIGNEELSLRWIAGNILYTNVDYLGKVFKKETGRNFSHYVMEKRMEAAKTSILEGVNYKIYEIAEKVGFGSNSQYFSQVFKKYTGVSPLEYKEYAKALKRNNAVG